MCCKANQIGWLSSVTSFSRKNPYDYRFLRMFGSTKTNPPPESESETLPWPLILQPCYTFTESQQKLCLGDPSIAQIVEKKTARKQFFYGIETKPFMKLKMAMACVDFNIFQPQLPSFVSVLSLKIFTEFMERTTMKNVPNMQLIPHLYQHIAAMPHLTLFRLTQQLMDDFLALNFNNVLIIRGDHVEEEQEYNYANQAVEYLRCAAGERLSIAVAGYPEGYTSISAAPRNKQQEIKYLKQKIDAGANFIISQLCYSADKIIEFIRDARSAGITVPIVIGVIVPDSLRLYKLIKKITKVRLPPKQEEDVESLENNEKVRDYFIQLAVCNIQQVMDANLGVYGIQFCTLNRFGSLVEVLSELHARGIINDKSIKA